MHLHTRTAVVRPDVDPLEARAWSLEVAALVGEITGLTVQTWRGVYGRPIGTTIWSIAVESMSAMADATAKGWADERYLAALGRGRPMFLGPAEDHIVEIVHAVGPGSGDEEVFGAVAAQCAGGHIADAVAWGIEATEHFGALTGLDVYFVRGLFGPWASVGWLSVAPSVAAYEAAGAALAADPAWVQRLDAGGAFFHPGATTSWMGARLR